MVAEVVLFKVMPEYSTEDFVAAVAEMQPDVAAMPGFMDRELLQDAHDQWIDIIHWETLEAAQQAAQTLETYPSAQRFFSMLELASINMMHLHPRFTTR